MVDTARLTDWLRIPLTSDMYRQRVSNKDIAQQLLEMLRAGICNTNCHYCCINKATPAMQTAEYDIVACPSIRDSDTRAFLREWLLRDYPLEATEVLL